jgi:membrane protease YdiL (CAAX protease family)
MSFVPVSPAGDTLVAAPASPTARKPYPSFWEAVLLVILVQVIANALAAGIMVFDLIRKGNFTPEAAMGMDVALLGIIANGVGFGSVIYFGWWRSYVPARIMFPLRGVNLLVWLPMMLMMAGGLLVVNELTNNLVRYLPPPDFVKELFAEFLGKGKGITGFIFLVIVAPITEELLFRGVMLNGFLPRYGKTKAILASGFLFGIIHLLPWQVLPAFALGLLFAWWTVETRSLWPALIAHAATNAFAFFQSASQESTEIFQVVDQPVWLTLLGILLLVAGTLGAAAVFRRDRTKRPASLIADQPFS